MPNGSSLPGQETNRLPDSVQDAVEVACDLLLPDREIRHATESQTDRSLLVGAAPQPGCFRSDEVDREVQLLAVEVDDVTIDLALALEAVAAQPAAFQLAPKECLGAAHRRAEAPGQCLEAASIND